MDKSGYNDLDGAYKRGYKKALRDLGFLIPHKKVGIAKPISINVVVKDIQKILNKKPIIIVSDNEE